MTTNKAEEIREDIIERTAKNIPTRVHEDYVKTQIRIALNNYAVPFEKEIDSLTKEVERLRWFEDFFNRQLRRKEQLKNESDMDFGVGDLD